LLERREMDIRCDADIAHQRRLLKLLRPPEKAAARDKAPMSEYELQRRARVAENADLMQRLGIIECIAACGMLLS
jgi:hypothetical protein